MLTHSRPEGGEIHVYRKHTPPNRVNGWHTFYDPHSDSSDSSNWTMGREGRDEYGESLAPEQPDSLVMGASVQWYSIASAVTKKRSGKFRLFTCLNVLNSD